MSDKEPAAAQGNASPSGVESTEPAQAAAISGQTPRADKLIRDIPMYPSVATLLRELEAEFAAAKQESAKHWAELVSARVQIARLENGREVLDLREELAAAKQRAADWKKEAMYQCNKADRAEAEVAALREWLDNNTTFYDVVSDGPESCTSGPNIPVLASVSKRIWYHATDDQTSYPFSTVADAARKP